MTNNQKFLIDQQKAHAINEAKKREADARAALEVAQKQENDASAALDEDNKQEADAKKKHADAEAGFITFVVSSAVLVSKCRIPTVAVAQRGLFRILVGSGVTDIQSKNMEWPNEYYNSYEEPSETMEVGEPSGPRFTNAGADAGVSPEEYAAWFS
jgi:hypothetical protein